MHNIAVPVKDPKNKGKLLTEQQPMLYPHEILAFLWNHVGISVPMDDTRKFWQEARKNGEAWALDSTATEEHVPLGLYGDGARLATVFEAQNIVGLFLNILLFRPRSVRASRFLLWSCEKAQFYRNRTLNAVLRVVVWSLNSAFVAKWPTFDFKGRLIQSSTSGTPLTFCNTKFAIAELRGDWEWHKMQWRFTCSWNSLLTCFRCPCKSSSSNPGELYHTVDESAEAQLHNKSMHACMHFCGLLETNKLICMHMK